MSGHPKSRRRRNALDSGRLRRELRTIEAMVAITCRSRHGGRRRALCAECAGLLDYARERLACCPFGEEKPTCARCRVHCYRPEMRERVREVMRFAGPRMLGRHPVLALLHLLVDERREPPEPRRRADPARAMP